MRRYGVMRKMERHLAYMFVSAVVLGIAMMIIPLTIYHQTSFHAREKASTCETKGATFERKAASNATLKGGTEASSLQIEEELGEKLISSLSHVTLIFFIGLSVAVFVSLLIKRMLL